MSLTGFEKSSLKLYDGLLVGVCLGVLPAVVVPGHVGIRTVVGESVILERRLETLLAPLVQSPDLGLSWICLRKFLAMYNASSSSSGS